MTREICFTREICQSYCHAVFSWSFDISHILPIVPFLLFHVHGHYLAKLSLEELCLLANFFVPQ